MAVILNLPSAFDRFRREGEIIGRLVIEYGELEWDLCLLVSTVIGDQDAAVKALYRVRGETSRIDIGDALVRNKLPTGVDAAIYSDTIAGMRKCLSIRNKYAHANWTNTTAPDLVFLDIERLAKSDDRIDLSNIRPSKLSLVILEDQQRYFTQVMQNLRYLNMECRSLLGENLQNGYHYVMTLVAPEVAAPLPRR